MTHTPTTDCSLAQRLCLGDDEITALGRQGFVSCEYRAGRGPYFKLRFRVNGRQRVRYLGANPEAAAEIAAQVARLQTTRHAELELSRLSREARRLARQIKHELQPTLNQHGLRFHGLQIRNRSKS